LGFNYFQIDTTGARETPGTTLERDFIIYAPITWKQFYLSPFWDTFLVADEWTNHEFGSNFSIDTILNPSFSWVYNFTESGAYFSWQISHDIDISINGQRLGTLTGVTSMGMDAHERTTIITLSSIDWGLNLSIPLTQRFAVMGMLHFAKSLSRAEDEYGNRYYEDIIPWAGLKLSMLF
jgi:hypothetical protein